MQKKTDHSWKLTLWMVVGLVIVAAGYKFFYPNHVDNDRTSYSQLQSHKIIKVEEENSAAISSSKKADDKIWTKKQDKKLAEFMNDWQETMGQPYKGTYENKSVSFNGVSFPDYLKTGNVTVNATNVQIKWAKNKAVDSSYQVVAVYAGSAYIYMFTMHNDVPEILVTSYVDQNSANFTVTQNTELVNEFKKLVNDNK